MIRKAEVGEVVLFKIDNKDFGVWRPLLVTWVSDSGVVDGEVFFSWDRDFQAEWPQRFMFSRLDKMNRQVMVHSVAEGEGVGCFKFRPDREKSEGEKVVEAAFSSAPAVMPVLKKGKGLK